VKAWSQSPKKELECEAHFKTNFRRLDSGEYSVRLPAKNTLKLLGESYNQAYCPLLNLENKLEQAAFIREYLNLNHMFVVPRDSLSLCKYILPHHCVFKEDSTTTQVDICKMYRCVRVADSNSYLQCIL